MPIELTPLPYARDALEPHISAATVDLHHGRHEAGYVERVNAIAKDLGVTFKSLEDAVADARERKHTPLFNMAAQAWNHWFYWQSMRPHGGGRPGGAIGALIDRQPGGYDRLAADLRAAATAHFGSGWAWLVVADGRPAVTTTGNAELPPAPNVPLLVIDVWEHAYYLDYRNQRAAYVAAVVDHLLNWDWANARLAAATAATPAARSARA